MNPGLLSYRLFIDYGSSPGSSSALNSEYDWQESRKGYKKIINSRLFFIQKMQNVLKICESKDTYFFFLCRTILVNLLRVCINSQL